MSVDRGTRFGPYEIVSPLGQGGMGEVYRARDTRLGRDVAIKVLNQSHLNDTVHFSRLEQEACAAGSLNHPNVLAIHDIGTYEGSPYVVSELLEGETLRELLGSGALPQRKVIDYAMQIARGLAAAHEKGIVHRDLKPENLFVTRDGHIKILDFGLARLTGQPDGDQSQSSVPTRRVNTDPGIIMGTVGYMSPEQIRGRPVDHRSDIFSFGSILFEMLSGMKAFQRDSSADTMSAILKEDPPEMSSAHHPVSVSLQRLVLRCLEKDPSERFHSISDFAFALDALSGTNSLGTAEVGAAAYRPDRSWMRSPFIWTAAGAIVVIGLLFAYFYWPRRPEQLTNVSRFQIPPPQNAVFAAAPLISPDGRALYYRVRDASRNVTNWVRYLDSLESQQISVDGGAFFWSPDSRSLGFLSRDKLRKVDLGGGPAQTICTIPPTYGSGIVWGATGVILLGGTDGIYKVSAGGGTPERITSLDASRNEVFHGWPSFLPDGRHFLFLARSAQRDKSAVYTGSIDSEETKSVLNVDSNAMYAQPGYLMFVREHVLTAQQFDADRLELKGEPFAVAESVQNNGSNARSMFSVSDTGVLVYRNEPVSPNIRLKELDRNGKEKREIAGLGIAGGIRLSPDESRIVFHRQDTEKRTWDLWQLDLERAAESRLTFEPTGEAFAVWSPDGARIAFAAFKERGVGNLYQKLTGVAASDELLLESRETSHPLDWSSDGRLLMYLSQSPTTGTDIWLLPLDGEKVPAPLLQSDFNEWDGRFSPDVKWIAYTSNESGTNEVYLQSFPAGEKWKVSNGGGSEPIWRTDGKELFYLATSGIHAVELGYGTASIKLGSVKKLFELPSTIALGLPGAHYAVSNDGRKVFLSVIPEEDISQPFPMVVVLNWSKGFNQ